MYNTGKPAGEIIEKQGLSQITDAGAIEETIGQVLEANQPAAADFKAGKDTALKFLVGQVMRATRGRASPQLAADLLRKRLEDK